MIKKGNSLKILHQIVIDLYEYTIYQLRRLVKIFMINVSSMILSNFMKSSFIFHTYFTLVVSRSTLHQQIDVLVTNWCFHSNNGVGSFWSMYLINKATSEQRKR